MMEMKETKKIKSVEDFKELRKVVDELNAPYDEDIESNFNFSLDFDGDCIRIWDRNETYNINYLDETNSLMYEAHLEFGLPGEFKPTEEDEIKEKLDNALRKDLEKEDVFFDWEDSLVLIVGVGRQ